MEDEASRPSPTTNFQMKYKYNPEHLQYMKEQVWECKNDLSVYDRLSEFEHNQIKEHYGNPTFVMDLGCGLGRGAVHLNTVLEPHEDNLFILADTTGNTENHGAWGLDEYYNDLNLTASFCLLNGLKQFHTFDTKRDDWDQELPKLDLIVSRCSFGMHFPIEGILPDLLKKSHKDTTMIFGTRNRERYSKESFKDLFQEVLFLEQELVPPFPHQDWLILKRPICGDIA